MKTLTLILLQVARAIALVWCCTWAAIALGILMATGSLDSAAGAGHVAVVYSVLGACVAAAAWVVLHNLARKGRARGFDILSVKRQPSLK
jgi:hypothetical protein